MLAYTLAKLIGTQQAVIERDMAAPDAFGGVAQPDWQPHLTVPCLLWWIRSSGIRSANREYVSPARLVAMSEGGLLLESNTDVTQKDRITSILDTGGNVLWEGIFEIVAVVQATDHMEIDVARPHLGG